MADRCPSCGLAVTAESARWCGSCGARLDVPRGTDRGDARAVMSRASDRTGGLLVGAAAPARRVPDEDAAGGTGGRAEAATEVVGRGARLRWARIAAVAVAVATVAAVLALQPEPEVVYPVAGHTAGGDAARTGRVSHAPLGELPTEVAWTAATGTDNVRWSLVSGPGLVAERHLDRTAGRDPATGAVRWVRDEPSTRTGAAVVGDVLVEGTGEGVRALDASTGRVRWEIPLPAERIVPGPTPELAILRAVETVSAVSTADGAIRWSRDLRAQTGAPSLGILELGVGDEVVAISGVSPPGLPLGSARSRKVALGLDLRTGSVRWVREITTGSPAESAGLVAAGPYTVLSDSDGRVVLDADGREVGRPVTDEDDGAERGAPPDAFTVVAEGLERPVLATASATGVVTGRDLLTGEVHWRVPLLDGPLVGAATSIRGTRDGRFVVRIASASRDRVVALDPVTGTIVATLRDASAREGSVGGDGTLVEPTPTGYRYRSPGGPDWSVAIARDPGGGPAIRDGLVAVPTTTGTVALELADGAERWRIDVGTIGARLAPVRWGTPAIGEDAVAASPPADGETGASTAELAGYDLLSGVTTWTRSPDATPPRGEVTLDGTEAFVPVRNEIHAYDLVTGRRSFAARSVAGIGAVAVTANNVVGTPAPTTARTSGDTLLEAIGLERRTRATLWRIPAPDVCGPPAIAEDAVPVAPALDRADPAVAGPSRDAPIDLAIWGTLRDLVAVDVVNGRTVWTVPLAGPACHAVAIVDGRAITTAGFDGRAEPGQAPRDVPLGRDLAAIDLATGAIEWRIALPAPAVTDPVVAGDQIVIGLADGRLVTVAPGDGAVTSEVTLDGLPAAAPAIAPDGTVVVLLTDGRTVALR